MLNEKEIEVLRELARKYMSYATLPIQNEKRALWYSLNRLDMQKPMVLIDQIPWNELARKDAFLNCVIKDDYWRMIEDILRTSIYKWEHIPVDMVLTPYIRMPRPIVNTGYGFDFVVEKKGKDENGVFSQSFTDVLSTEEDLARLHPAEIYCDEEREKELRELSSMIFDGIAPVKFEGTCMHLGIWDWISEAKGVTNCYYDLVDRPEFMHAIMDKVTGYIEDTIEKLNKIGGFDGSSTICHCSHTFCDDLPCDSEYNTSDKVWAFGLAQLFSSVSPEVTEEFEVPYMKRIFRHFGAIYYGCCDRLDDRLDIIDQMPNIRKISCSPWSKREEFAANLPKKYVMSNKPNPAILAGSTFDEQAARDDIRRTINAAKAHNVPLEMILKDISTVREDPSRLWRWAEIAMEETSNF